MEKLEEPAFDGRCQRCGQSDLSLGVACAMMEQIRPGEKVLSFEDFKTLIMSKLDDTDIN